MAGRLQKPRTHPHTDSHPPQTRAVKMLLLKTAGRRYQPRTGPGRQLGPHAGTRSATPGRRCRPPPTPPKHTAQQKAGGDAPKEHTPVPLTTRDLGL